MYLHSKLVRRIAPRNTHYGLVKVARRHATFANRHITTATATSSQPQANDAKNWHEHPLVRLSAYSVAAAAGALALMFTAPLALNGLAKVRAMLPVGDVATWVELVFLFLSFVGSIWAAAMAWARLASLVRNVDNLSEDVKELRKDTNEGLKELCKHTDEGLKELRKHTDEGLKELCKHTDEGLKELCKHTDEGLIELRNNTNDRLKELRNDTNERLTELSNDIKETNRVVGDMSVQVGKLSAQIGVLLNMKEDRNE